MVEKITVAQVFAAIENKLPIIRCDTYSGFKLFSFKMA